ncbi:MAG: hypothetical protein KatS3mg118_0756 [Paracoccaceae bacterium]|nr:MAG: hypothetical protein KatS3mg118_0756 [Paracoccaceae bacterium]
MIRAAPWLALLAGILAACAMPPVAPDRPARPTLPGLGSALAPGPVLQANRDIAEDLADLVFGRESGLTLTRLTRFETPVRVSLATVPPAGFADDLAALITRLRDEARIDIALAGPAEPGNIVIDFAPAAEIAAVFPGAQCFVIPAARDWAGFRRDLALALLPDWDALDSLTGAGLFLPADGEAETLRECLEEELAQALGPANDLFRLRDSVFNDDNVHSRLTRFDILVLRTLYDPGLHSGMTRARAVAAARAVLDRINPAGRGIARRAGLRPAPEWERIMRSLFEDPAPRARRIAALRRAVRLAQRFPQPDHRLATTLDFLATLEYPDRPELAEGLLARALDSLERHDDPQGLRAATIRLHLAQLRMRLGRPAEALALADAALPALVAHDAAGNIARALALRTAALATLGRAEEARISAVDSSAWQDYVRGSRPIRPPAGGRR